jgi:hypothetical protein
LIIALEEDAAVAAEARTEANGLQQQLLAAGVEQAGVEQPGLLTTGLDCCGRATRIPGESGFAAGVEKSDGQAE